MYKPASPTIRTVLIIIGVVCECLCTCMCSQLCPTLCDPRFLSPWNFPARILEWVAVSSSKGFS